MSEEEILNMKILIGHLDLTTDTKNKLYNQTTKIEDILNKQKEVLDKIKDFIEEFNKNVSYLRWNEDDYVDYIKKIEELLEEIE